MMMMMVTIMPAPKPLQGRWGERQELAGDGSSRQVAVQAGDRNGSRLGHRLAACSPLRQHRLTLLPSPSLLGGSSSAWHSSLPVQDRFFDGGIRNQSPERLLYLPSTSFIFLHV